MVRYLARYLAVQILPSHSASLEGEYVNWTEINNRDNHPISQRTNKLIQNPNAIVETATDLLTSFHWSEIAAGLAVLTGRRCT